MTTQAEVIAATGKTAGDQPGKTEGVDMAGAIKAFNESRKAERAEERADLMPPAPPAAVETGATDDVTATTAAGDAVEMSAEADATAQTDKPAATETTTVEVDDGDALKTKLRAKQAARAREVESKRLEVERQELALKQQRETLEAEKREIQEQRARATRLEQLRQTDPRAWLKEQGIALPDLVNAELAEMSPEARAKQMGATIQNLPKLIEQEVQKRIDGILQQRSQDLEKQTRESQQKAHVAATEQAFVERAKGDEKRAATKALASRSPQAVVSLAYVVQAKFVEEHGRRPTERELDANVESWLGGTPGAAQAAQGETARTGGSKHTSPRAAAREGGTKPLAQMSEEERIDAARRQFLLDQKDTDSGLRR